MKNHVLFATGFRPFFLCAAVYAIVLVPVWLASLRGGFAPPMHLFAWHVHEMIFGFAVAVIAGFLLTAVRHWTGGRRTASGASLALLLAVWLAGRVALLPGLHLPAVVVLLTSLSFLPLLAIFVARPIILARSARNYKVLVLLGVLWSLQVALLVRGLDLLSMGLPMESLLHASTLTVVWLCLLITGRIVPLFTKNATGVLTLRTWRPMEIGAMSGAALLIPAVLLLPSSQVTHVLSFVTGVLVLLRMRYWGTRHALRDPLLWILHAGHLWLAVGFLLWPLQTFELSGPVQSGALHALAYGGIGTLILGMMSRVTLGHTGRALETPALVHIAFYLFTLGALVRVFGALALPDSYTVLLNLAGGCWTIAFILYLAAQGRMLVTRRPDGEPG